MNFSDEYTFLTTTVLYQTLAPLEIEIGMAEEFRMSSSPGRGLGSDTVHITGPG